MWNESRLKIWKKENACRLQLIKCFCCVLSTLLLYSLSRLQPPQPLLICHLLLLILLIPLFPPWYHLQPPTFLRLIWILHFGGALIPTAETGLILYIKINSFTLLSFIFHHIIKDIFLLIMHPSRLTSKLILLMGPIVVHMQMVTKVIQKIHLRMKLWTEMNLDTTLQQWRKRLNN